MLEMEQLCIKEGEKEICRARKKGYRTRKSTRKKR